MISRPHLLRPAGRFAPTPSGALHVGNGYTALLAHICAKSMGFSSILRVDDLELRPSTAQHLQAQYKDLSWLGIEYDESPLMGGLVGPYRQSERTLLYTQALNILNEQGLLYPCYCSRKEIAAVAPHAQDEGLIYPGTCRPSSSTPLDLDRLPVINDRVPALRFNLIEHVRRRKEGAHFSFVDQIAGACFFNLSKNVGDFLVRRRDQVFAYQLACAVDDYTQGCQIVLRGSDLLISTARQLIILESLEIASDQYPSYAHVGLVVDSLGERLAKRNQSVQLGTLSALGVSPEEIRCSFSVAWGGSPTGNIRCLIEEFDLQRLPKDSVRWSSPLARRS